MSSKFIAGDLFDSSHNLIARGHGCNGQGIMGAGIALLFKKRYPDMYMIYRNRCLNNIFHHGSVYVYESPNGQDIVFNLATQRGFDDAELGAIRSSCLEMIAWAELYNKGRGRFIIDKIGLPRIGAGLGGLEWEEVKVVLIEVGETTKIELLVFETFLPK